MRENELADLLIRMAADHGVDVEPAAEELASIALPSFVDARAFRNAIIQALEAQMRAQMEQRLQSIRQRFEGDSRTKGASHAKPAVAPPIVAPSRDSVRSSSAMDGMPPITDATLTDLAALAPQAEPEPPVVAEEEELPTDATMVWTTRHG